MITKLNFEIDRIDNYMNYVPYIVTLQELYNAKTLYAGYDYRSPDTWEHCYDQEVYRHYLEKGKQTVNPLEQLSRSIHDHFIRQGINHLVGKYDKCKVVGVMGGHGLLRTDSMYRKIVFLSKKLTESGSLMVTGGGPGAMEATHLGAWMAGRTDEEVDEALRMLQVAPCFRDGCWLQSSFEVMERFPQTEYESLGVPTWLYGHEPSAPFATHIAKLFENSIREDVILTIAMGGIVFTPGSAGTMQEIFQEAVQNHYLSFGFSSPMAFLGVEFWTETLPAYTMLQRLMNKGLYKNLLLSISDDENDIIDTIEEFQMQQSDLHTAVQINDIVKKGKGAELIIESEMRQETCLWNISGEIAKRNIRLVLIAGPSSSGKTTTSKRLAEQLKGRGMHPHTISTDDYFVNRVDTPKDANGEYDFECIEAVDTKLFQQQMSDLLSGDKVELPRYDFKKGERVFEGNMISIGEDDVIILEGNHALNPIMSQQIPKDKILGIYVSAASDIELDDGTTISTSDIRLLRRIIRDFRTRGYSAHDTIKRCPSVTRGEDKWIIPFRNNAEIEFNTVLPYELCVLRNQVMPLLMDVSECDECHDEAQRLIAKLESFYPLPSNQVPPESLLREFVGGSSFNY